MNDTIIVAIISLITAIITGWFTSRSKNKEIELLKDKNEKEIQSLKKKHQHEKETLQLTHQHELEKLEKEAETQLEINTKTGIDSLVQNQFSKRLEDPNSPMSGFIQDLIQDEIDKNSKKSNKHKRRK